MTRLFDMYLEAHERLARDRAQRLRCRLDPEPPAKPKVPPSRWLEKILARIPPSSG